MSDDPDIRRRWIREAAIVLALAVAGVVVAVAWNGYTVGEGVGIGLFSLAGVAGTCFVFYEIGRSEDLDRARGGHGPYDRPRADGPAPPTRDPRPRRRPRRGGHHPG